MRRLLALLVLIPSLAFANVVTLDSTTRTLELEVGSSGNYYVVVSYVDVTSSTYTPGSYLALLSGVSGTTTILAAPAASTQRGITSILITNTTTSSRTLRLKVDSAGTDIYMTPAISVGSDETLRVDNEGRIEVLTAGGTKREAGYVTPGYGGADFDFYKVGATSEAVAVNYLHSKDTGYPGAWVLGTPGLNGANFDCSTTGGATTAGAPYIPNPAAGGNYLTYGSIASTVSHSMWLADLLWYNTGLVVTTTTAQAITTPAFPARDNQGSTNGEGFQAAIVVTTATTNASAVTNTTLSYTNSEGTAGRTATMASFPATAVAGAFVPFQLQAGDRGIRSIQSVTLGTSYVTGAVSLVVFNLKMRQPSAVVNVGTIPYPPQSPGVRLYNGTCLAIGYLASATTATTTSGSFWIMNR